MEVCWLIWVVCLSLLPPDVKMNRYLVSRTLMDAPALDSSSSSVSPPADQWFSQKLDHRRENDTSTWLQRYWMRKDLYKDKGPVFLLIGGEGQESAKKLVTNRTWEVLARRNHAFMILLEHRFYGLSGAPGSGHSLEGLEYFSIEQALGDVAYFISKTKEALPHLAGDTRWVVFGGSYSGNLATWMRYKYPHLVYAAAASSAPLLAKMDFSGYFDTVATVLKTYNQNCLTDIQETLKEVDDLLKSASGRATVQKKFQLCTSLNTTNKYDMALFYQKITEHIGIAVQNNFYSYICDTISNSSSNQSRMERYISSLLEFQDESDCFNVVNEEQLNYELKLQNDSRWQLLWNYQGCSELGYFRTSERNNSLFGSRIPVQYFVNNCAYIFGDKFTESVIEKGVDRTNSLYGGLGINVTRVVFTYGTYDPWHTLGLSEANNPLSPVIMIKGSTHGADVYPGLTSDSAALRESRGQVSDILARWLAQPST